MLGQHPPWHVMDLSFWFVTQGDQLRLTLAYGIA
jgi:hypothetical protein